MRPRALLAPALALAACAPAPAYRIAPRAQPRATTNFGAARSASGARAQTSDEGGAEQSGAASFYSDRLAGNTTANGETYDPEALTAAHRSLRFGTRVRVTRDDDGRSVIVCVNDRGPYVDGRIIDLSRAAAEALGMIRAGVVDVSIAVVEPPTSRRCE